MGDDGQGVRIGWRLLPPKMNWWWPAAETVRPRESTRTQAAAGPPARAARPRAHFCEARNHVAEIPLPDARIGRFLSEIKVTPRRRVPEAPAAGIQARLRVRGLCRRGPPRARPLAAE